MTKAPYPGFPPNNREVTTVNGRTRQCLVVELRSLGALSDGQMAVIREQLEATVDRLKSKISVLDQSELISQDRFDPMLVEGLRLGRSDGGRKG